MDAENSTNLQERLLRDEVSDYVYLKDIEKVQTKRPWWKCRANLSNKTVLLIVFCLFAVFASAETGGSLMARSLALFGDAVASCVDVVTYFMNWYAETLATPDEPVFLEDGASPTNHTATEDTEKRIDKPTRLLHEVYAPVLSVIALVGVTIFILIVASFEIASGGDDTTSADLMFTFAAVNVIIDVICIGLFYCRKDDILYHRFPSFSADTEHVPHSPLSPVLRNVNINMFSAFTHIGSDTLRTAAIFLAAIVSSTTGIKSSRCDAWAAVLVSVTIFVAVFPLANEVFAAYTGERQ
eukprot:gene28430-32113_t